MKVIKPGNIDKVLPREHITCSNCGAILEITSIEKITHYLNIGVMCYETGHKYVICIECGCEVILT